MARTPRKWTGARSPSGLKRVRSAARRHEILQPRRTAAKTLVKKALAAATVPAEGVDTQAALSEAFSALDRAAKVGAVHPNAAARRKSRLARAISAATTGTQAQPTSRSARSQGAAAQKATRARIAASRAVKAKGAQTAAGKARAALSKTARAEAAEQAQASPPATTEKAPTARARATAPKAGARTGTTARTAASKAGPKAAAKAAPKTAAKAATRTSTTRATPKKS